MTCPRSFECEKPLVSLDVGPIPSYVGIASGCVSCLGSALVIATYLILKDKRRDAQKIITNLAVADFFVAAGFILGAVNFMVHFNEKDERRCNVFQVICAIQSFITTWTSDVCFVLTSALAFHFYLHFRNHAALAARLIPVYVVVAWAGPLLILLPMLCLGKLGYSPYAASNWCYVKDEDYSEPVSHETTVFIIIAAWLWGNISFVVVLVLYGTIGCALLRKSKFEKRLLLIPMLFIFLRMWDTVQNVTSIIASNHIHDTGCVSSSWRDALFALAILQATGDGGQGWGNCILFVLASKELREGLFNRLCRVPCRKILSRSESSIQVGGRQPHGILSEASHLLPGEGVTTTRRSDTYQSQPDT